MTAQRPLFNLLPYRPETTGLSRYVQRLLTAWPEQPLPPQLRLAGDGHPEVVTSPDLPAKQSSGWMRFLQSQALVQHAIRVRRHLSDHQPSCIYSPYSDFLWALSDLPQVITCHDLTPLFYPNSRRAYWRSRLWLPRHFQQAQRVVAISRSVADQLIATGLPAQRIDVVPNGVEPVAAPITEPGSQDCLLLARHARNKNVGLALSGFARLLTLAPNWTGQLLVVGTPDRCTPSLLRQERELGLVGRVRWIPRLAEQELMDLWRRCFCLLSTSLMEGFDYPLLEAQAQGLPTLASTIPVHHELHRESTLFFELFDGGDTMAGQLLRLSREPALWQQLSQAGLRNAAALSTTRQAEHLCHLLNALTG